MYKSYLSNRKVIPQPTERHIPEIYLIFSYYSDPIFLVFLFFYECNELSVRVKKLFHETSKYCSISTIQFYSLLINNFLQPFNHESVSVVHLIVF